MSSSALKLNDDEWAYVLVVHMPFSNIEKKICGLKSSHIFICKGSS